MRILHRNTIQNYTQRGDVILTSDWYWSPYATIAQELERSLETYETFDADGNFNVTAFKGKMNELLDRQGRVVIIINTPAHNPTGFSLSGDDWDNVLGAMKDSVAGTNKKVVFLADIAYIDFGTDPQEDRQFLKKFETLPDNVLPLISFSISKSLTMYGMRGGALLCMTNNAAIANEFKNAMAFSARGTWSNGTRCAMVAVQKIFDDPALLAKVMEERSIYSKMLLARGAAFVAAAEKVGLRLIPFKAGFFLIVPCDDPVAVGSALQKEGVFIVPFGGKGLRVSIASLSEAKCAAMPETIIKVMKELRVCEH